MNTIEFINHLRKLDINLFCEGERLRCKAPEGILTPALKSEISERKAEIISFLQQANFQTNTTAIAVISRTENNIFPLSFTQEGLWFLYELQPNIPFYNIPLNLHFRGKLDIAALESSLQLLITRHEILRTNFITVDGKPAQIINATIDFTLPVVNLRSLSASERDLEYQKLASLAISHVFSLTKDSLIRTQLVQLTPTENVLLLTIHHIIFDGWSVNIFIQELTTIYSALVEQGKPHLPEINLQYVDFAVWQKQWLQGEVLESQLAYWQQKLTGMPALLELPTDRPRPAVQSFRGETQFFTIEPEISEALVNLSQQQEVTLFILLLTAFKILLYRYTNQPDIVVGSPSANRQNPQIQGMIGFFVNNLVLRTDLSGNPNFLQLLQQVKKVVLEAYKHQDLPFNKLVEALHPERNLSYSPLFQIVFALEHEPASNIILQNLTISTSEPGFNQTAKLDLSLSLHKTEQGLIGGFEYSTDLFNASTITRMIEHWQTLLAGIVANPQQRLSDLPILTAIEQHKLLVEWNQTQQDYPQNLCIHQLFEQQVEQTPDAIAVIFKDEQLTYRELNTKANQLAHHLQALGVKPETLVGICVERSLEMIVGLLGILKAGGAYVPIDPAYPPERITYMLDDSRLPVLLTQQKLAASLPEHQARVVCLDADWEKISVMSFLPPITGVTSENLAYIIYTSGSTGKPKGVLIAHQGLCNLVETQIKLFNLRPDSRVLQFASISFDASIWEIVMALCVGAKLCLGTRKQLQPGLTLLQLLREQKITHANLVPSVLAALPDEELPTLENIVVGGEECPPSLVERWANGRHFFNLYGPTESTVCATITQCFKSTGALSIGRPISNTKIYILDHHLQPVPIGVPGELHVAGVGLARGYLNLPALTEEKFIPNPFSNERRQRLYKTGDLARYLPDGNIEYLGRIDNQVKIRGFRIELGEIEAALTQHPDVIEGVIICREDNPGDKKIVGYITCNLILDRIPYHSECQLELDSNGIKCHTEDISRDGVVVVGVPAINLDKSCHLHLQLPGEEVPQRLSGTVTWSHPPKAGVGFHLTPPEQTQVEQSIAYQLESQDWWKTLQRTIIRNMRDYLKQKLPSYMIPSAFVLMKALPLTPNGKIDRRALPAPDSFHNDREDKFAAPRTPTEAKLAAIWAQVLGVQQVGINDNFFELGGHSLLATQIISCIRQAFAIELPLRHLFEAPTIASLCKILETEYATTLQELSDYSIASQSLPPFVPATREGHLPLSIQQEYIWHVQQLNPHSCGCNSGVALRLTFKVSSEALEKSINEIIRRHESLRTTFPVVEDQPVQAIAPELTLPLKIVDLQNLPSVKREAEALHFSEREMNYHFDLTNGPLIKATLVRLSSEEHWLLIPMHHIITDGWSISLFVQELETVYYAFSNNLPSPLPELPLQYADFTLWQRQRFNEEVLARQLDYWVQKLANPLQLPEYQPNRESKPNPNSDRASSYSLTLREELVADIKDLGRSQSVTTSTILLAALSFLLFKYHEQNEILIVATIGNRNIPEIETMLGCFINDVILRSHLNDEQTGVTLLEQVKETFNGAIENKEIPLQQVIKVVKTKRKLTFSASVTIVPPLKISEERFVSKLVLDSDKNKLWDDEIPLKLYIFSASEASKTIEIYALYNTDLFGNETIKWLFNYYQEILQNLVNSPELKIGAFEQFEKKDREGIE